MSFTSDKVCHFLCIQCQTVFPLEENVFLRHGFFLICPTCTQPVSVRKIFHRDELEVLEIYGCQYFGATPPSADSLASAAKPIFLDSSSLEIELGTWIEDTVSKIDASEIPPQDPFADEPHEDTSSAKRKLLDIEHKEWSVEKRNRELLHFDSFAQVRKAVEQGNIEHGDFIITTQGERRAVHTYPGTADLFGNVVEDARSHRPLHRPGQTGRFKVQPQRRFGQFIFSLLKLASIVAVAGTIVFAFVGQKKWAIQEGERLLQGVSQMQDIPRLGRFDVTLQLIESILRSQATDQFETAVSHSIAAIQMRPGELTSVSLLSQSWLELGRARNDKAMSKKGKALATYLKHAASSLPSTHIALARMHWHNGQAKKAMNLLIGPAQNLPLAKSLLIDIYLQEKKYDDATILLSSLHQVEPGNQEVIHKLVMVFESQNKLRQAISYQDKLVAMNPHQLGHHQKLIDLLTQAQDFDSLESYLIRYRSLGAQQEFLHFEYLKLLDQMQRSSRLIPEALTFMQQFPKSAFKDEAQRLYSKALANQPASQGSPATQQPSQAPSRRLRRR